MRYAIKRQCDDAIAISHRWIGSRKFIREKKQWYVNTAICDCDIASEEVKWCDIGSEEGKWCDIGSEEGCY